MTPTSKRARGLAGTVFVLAGAWSVGCQDDETGPKRADHRVAHAARYHPDVSRASATDTGVSEPAASQPFALTRPAHLFRTSGPVGSPVLFVNGDVLTVPQILEPIVDDLTEQCRILGESGYAGYLVRRVGDRLRLQISSLVVYQQAKEAIPEKAREMLDKEVERILKQEIDRRFEGVQARYEKHLTTLGLTVEDAKGEIRREIIVREFLHQRFAPRLAEPPRRELKKYYDMHVAEFSTPPKAELFLIEIPLEAELGKPVDRATAQEISEARRQARGPLERAREELESGVDFASVARRYSKGIRKDAGGAWGEIVPEALHRRWARPAEVLFSLEEGQISDIVESDEALFIVKCGQRAPGNTQSFEEAQTEIITRMKDEEYQRLTDAYIKGLLTRATMNEDQQQGFFEAILAAAPQPVPEKPEEGKPADPPQARR